MFPIRPRSRCSPRRLARLGLESLEGRELCAVAAGSTPPTVVSLQRFGVHGAPARLVLTFSQPLDPLSATDLNNYALSSTSLDHRYLTALNLTPDPIVSATYDPATRSVTLFPSKKLPLDHGQELIVKATATGGVANQQGVFLNGNSNGTPGNNYVAIFGGRRSLKPIFTNGASVVIQVPTATVGRDRMTGYESPPYY